MKNTINEKAIAEFKQRVLTNAEETKKAWEQGVNKFINRHADLMMVDCYAQAYGADAEELKKFINDAYAL